jgi:cell division protein FtsB
MSLRREVLLEEQKSVWLTIRQIDDQIKEEHKQIDHIDRERKNIQQQIQDLQLR